MKKLLFLSTFLFVVIITQAQTINYLKYQMNLKNSNIHSLGKSGDKYEIEIKSNNNYIIYHRYDISGKETRCMSDLIFDLKEMVTIFDLDNQNAYHIEYTENIYKHHVNLETTGEKKVINGHNCLKYQVKHPRKFVDDYYTLWIDTNIKVNPVFNKYYYSFISNHYRTFCEIPGLIVQVDINLNSDKQIFEGTFTLIKSSEKELKESEISFPWANGESKPGLFITNSSVDFNNNRSTRTLGPLWSVESGDEYEKRMRDLFLKITKKEVDKFKSIVLYNPNFFNN